MTKLRQSSGAALGLVRGLTALVAFAVLFAVGVANVEASPRPAWKLLAVTGPTHLPPRQSETQRVTVEATGGTFTLARLSGEGEGVPVGGSGVFELTEGSNVATVVFSASPLQIGQLVTGTGIAPETTVIGTTSTAVELSAPATENTSFAFLTGLSKELSGVRTLSGEFGEGDEVTGEDIAPGSTITSIAGGGSTLILSKYLTGASETPVPIVGRAVSGPIPYDAPASAIKAAVEGLGFGPSSIDASGGPGGTAASPYYVTFGGALAGTNVEPLSVESAGLEGQNADVHVDTTVPGGPGTGEITINPTNIGGAATSGPISVTLGPLPAGVRTSGQASGEDWTCAGGAGESSVTCTTLVTVPRLHNANNVIVPIEIDPAVATSASVAVEVSGGGAGSATTTMPIEISTEPVSPGIAAFWAGPFGEAGETEVQAGGHPYSAQTYFMLNTKRSASGKVVPVGDPRSVIVNLPAGFVGNPLVTPRCPQSQVTQPFGGPTPACNQAMTVGNFEPTLVTLGNASLRFNETRIYNDVPPQGAAAEFTTIVASPLQSLLGSVRSTEDFGIRITAPNNPNYNKIYGAFAALEGTPPGATGRAFIRNATDCAEMARATPVVEASFETWQEQGVSSAVASAAQAPVIGCDKLKFRPSFTFEPTTSRGSSGTGAVAHLHLPQDGVSNNAELATPDLKKAVVTLPQGLTLNPSSANGLAACSEAQIGYVGSGALPNPTRFNEANPECPDGSKLGSVAVESPLLEEVLNGTIYLAAQDENPFNSLIALYLVVDDARTGVVLKLPGEVKPDSSTGQLTATFDYNPQLPFEDLILRFRGGGGRSELATPEICGSYKTTGEFTPWSAPESGPPAPIDEAGFTVSDGCAASASSRPFAPSFEAGTTGTQAGSYSPLVLNVGRKDGEQELKSIDFTLPRGLTGKLAGIPYCSEDAIREAERKSGKAEQTAPSCPAASQIGTVDTAAGVGTEPIHVAGKVYLAGPYEGASLSSVVVTPAVAGPFDLGDVVVRAPLFVDPESAQITARSDAIPTILKGIPLKVRSVAINLDRSGFTLNPTSCEPATISASISGSSGATAKPSNRFQVGGCDGLKFRPKLKVSLTGPTRRGGLPALKAVLTYPRKGTYANISRAQVNLPHSEFLEQNNLNKTCTKPVLLEGKCPKSTIYGKAKAWTPLLDRPLQGPVFLVGGYGYKLPALVAELNGQIRVVLKGKVDSGPNKGIRNTFEAVPDAPVSRFVLEMKGGKKYGLLVNSENLCRKPQRAIARFTAQNGRVHQFKPLIRNDCHKKARHKKAKKGKPGKRSNAKQLSREVLPPARG